MLLLFMQIYLDGGGVKENDKVERLYCNRRDFIKKGMKDDEKCKCDESNNNGDDRRNIRGSSVDVRQDWSTDVCNSCPCRGNGN